MPDRARISVLRVVAHAVGAPCVALAAVLYFLTTWVPDALYKRDLMCVALLLAATGAGLVNLRGSSPRVRIAGGIAMAVGVVSALAVGAW
jgi:hypothetical protein